MKDDATIQTFLANYSDTVSTNAFHLREIIIAELRGITEQVDIPAKMIAYCYGQKYTDLVCTIIPSRKGLKLGFNRGTELPDPDKLLEGAGKTSRYIIIKSAEDVNNPAIPVLLSAALDLYKERTNK